MPGRRNRPARPPQAIVLANARERTELRALNEQIEALRDDIAELDCSIEVARTELEAFAKRHQLALAREHALLGRIESCRRHLERLANLARPVTPTPHAVDQAAGQANTRRALLERRRNRELDRWHAERLAALAADDAGQPKATTGAPGQQGADAAGRADGAADGAMALGVDAIQMAQHKALYRSLARRYHPDLAANEQQRSRHGRLMAHVNALWRTGDWPRLAALAAMPSDQLEQEPGGGDAWSEDASSSDWPALLRAARHALAWHQEILASLLAEQASLADSPLADLAAAVAKESRWHGADPFATLRRAARARAKLLLEQIPAAVQSLEDAVRAGQSKQAASKRTAARSPARSTQAPAVTSSCGKKAPASETALAKGRQTDLAPLFDPAVGLSFAQLGLDALAAQRVPPRVAAKGAALAQLAADQPALMRLVLLAYVAQLGSQPLDAVGSYQALACRFASLGRNDVRPLPLTEALVQGDGLVAYRLLGEPGRGAQARLCLREPSLSLAMPNLLQHHHVRHLFGEVLMHLGEAHVCRRCQKQGFALPLLWLHGLDNLRALVCQACGAVAKRYVLARGDDVQAVLNRAYLDFDLLAEARVAFGRRHIGLQMLSREADTCSMRTLCGRLAQDLFQRNQLDIDARDLVLHDGERALAANTVFGSLHAPSLTLRLRGRWAGREQAVTDELRFRVRTRYAPPTF